MYFQKLKKEQPLMQDAFNRAADACEYWLEKPFTEVMNRFN